MLALPALLLLACAPGGTDGRAGRPPIFLVSSSCATLCPECTAGPGDPTFNHCKCPLMKNATNLQGPQPTRKACWPGSSFSDTPDTDCNCFGKLGFCKPGQTPQPGGPDGCEDCWPVDKTACSVF